MFSDKAQIKRIDVVVPPGIGVRHKYAYQLGYADGYNGNQIQDSVTRRSDWGATYLKAYDDGTRAAHAEAEASSAETPATCETVAEPARLPQDIWVGFGNGLSLERKGNGNVAICSFSGSELTQIERADLLDAIRFIEEVIYKNAGISDDGIDSLIRKVRT